MPFYINVKKNYDSNWQWNSKVIDFMCTWVGQEVMW